MTNEVSSQEVVGQVQFQMKLLKDESVQNKKVFIANFEDIPVALANSRMGFADAVITYEIVQGLDSNQ